MRNLKIMWHSLPLHAYLQGFSGEILTLMVCVVCFLSIVFLFIGFGKMGIVSYIIMGTIVSNIQVLKTVVLQSTPEPMALGTVIFTSLFWAMALLTEQYGAKTARKTLYLSFSLPLLLLLWMILAIAYEPARTPKNFRVQEALEVLFLPAPALFIASLIAYFISQWVDIWVFSTLKTLTKERFLGTRAMISSVLSGFLDNAIFSILAWWVFGIQKVSLHMLFWTYILGAYGIRALLSLGAAPLLHLVRVLQEKRLVHSAFKRVQPDA